jgi:hypothetical protein
MGKEVMSMIIAMPAGMQRTKGIFIPEFQLDYRSGRERGIPTTG